LHDGVVFDPPRVRSETSRWRGAPHRLGTAGRLLATALVLLFGPWGTISFFTFLYTPVWVVVSTIVLKDVWRKTHVISGAHPDAPPAPPTARDRFLSRHPFLGRRIDPRTAVALGVAAMAVLVLLAIPRVHGPELFALAALGSMVGVGFLLAWLSGV
jgi:hypothetical protein